jgi:hypothetical protein
VVEVNEGVHHLDVDPEQGEWKTILKVGLKNDEHGNCGQEPLKTDLQRLRVSEVVMIVARELGGKHSHHHLVFHSHR